MLSGWEDKVSRSRVEFDGRLCTAEGLVPCLGTHPQD